MSEPVMRSYLDILAKKAHRIRVVKGDTIYLLSHPGGYEYPIALARCRTAEHILRWTAHLLETKDWFDTDMARDFIITSCHINGIDPFGV